MSRATDRAQSRHQEAVAQVEAWEQRVDQLTADLASAEANVGADALASGDLESTAAKVGSLRDQLAMARQTVTAAEKQRDAAQCVVWRAEAEDKRDEANRLDRDAAKHRAKTQALLDQMREHEGGPYAPDQPSDDPTVYSDKPRWTPRSDQLANHARALRAAAQRLDQTAHDLEQRRRVESPGDAPASLAQQASA